MTETRTGLEVFTFEERGPKTAHKAAEELAAYLNMLEADGYKVISVTKSGYPWLYITARQEGQSA